MKRTQAPAVRLKHLGAAGWEITAGDLTILLDPYLSRLRYRGRFGGVDAPAFPGDSRPVFGPDDDLVPDTATIDAHVARRGLRLRRVLGEGGPQPALGAERQALRRLPRRSPRLPRTPADGQ
ncbi:MAG TPA: hypothetical protein VGD07_09750 [Methylomirabilota bacterium]